MTKEEFIEKANAVHGGTYDYSLVEYKNNKTKVAIKCKECGTVFYQKPNNHLQGSGCPICARKKRSERLSDTREDFIRKAIEKHGDKYDYSLVEYVSSREKVKIRCKKCGSIFEQAPAMHLAGNGCSVCNPPHKKLTHEEFVERLAKTHPNLEVFGEYQGKDRKITVRCKIHDYTYQTTPHRLVQGANCKYCYNDRRGVTLRADINDTALKLKKVHGDRYEYPNIAREYKNNKSNLTVICPNHGIFISTANKLLKGCGCPYCDESHNEKSLARTLTGLGVKYEREKQFNWLGLQTLDFYLPDYNLALEIQGEFHFKSVTIKNTVVNHIDQVRRDERKHKLCEENGVKLIYIIPHKLMKMSKVSDIYDKSGVVEIDKNGELVGTTVKELIENC